MRFKGPIPTSRDCLPHLGTICRCPQFPKFNLDENGIRIAKQQFGRRWSRTAVLFFAFAPALSGQISLALSSGSANLSGTVSLNLNVTSTPGNEPAGVQWTLAYPAGDAVLASVVAGSSLNTAGKSIYCNGRIGTITCLGIGMNANPVSNGTVAVVTFSLAPATASSILPISMGGTVAVLGNGASIPVDGNGGAIAVAGWQPLVPAYFTDVAPSDFDYTAANLLYAQGITSGCSGNPISFCPDSTLTRGEMAVLLIRAIGGDPTSFNPTPYFADVPPSYLFFAWIQKLYELGITSGCSANPLIFCPDQPVTRGEIASFTTRGRYGPTTQFIYPAVPYFTDVPATDIFFSSIQKMAELGTSGCNPLLFCSTNATTRGETAVFLARGLLNQLLPIGTPVLSLVNPSVVFRGGPSVTIYIVGANTHFAAGATLNAGPGIAVSGVAALNAQTLVANLTVSPTATPGPRSLIVTTGSEEAVLPNGLMVQ
jgi:S-layer homology domain